jgi:hypothetical protein
MSFRDKEKRRGPIDTRTTLDAVHNEQVHLFNSEDKQLLCFEKEIETLKKKYKKLDMKLQIELSDSELQNKLDLTDKIKGLDKKIKLIMSQKNKTDYYLETGSIIFQYYDNKNSKEYTKETTPNNDNSIINMFKIEEKNKEVPKINENKDTTKTSIINQYMSYMDDEYLAYDNEEDIDTCQLCGSKVYILSTKSIIVCKTCGYTTDIIINSDKPSYKDPPREVSYFAYKRINHFNEWLAQFQAKESTDIPEEIYENIMYEVKKEKIFDIKKLSPDKLREILKKLRYNKYYEHVPHIINHMNGEPAPSMSRNSEEKLRMMFKEIQTPFVKYCPKDRKNFLSYSYVLHKFCELLSMDEYLDCFPLLKSREKLQQQDNIWERICGDLQWQYIPST